MAHLKALTERLVNNQCTVYVAVEQSMCPISCMMSHLVCVKHLIFLLLPAVHKRNTVWQNKHFVTKQNFSILFILACISIENEVP